MMIKCKTCKPSLFRSLDPLWPKWGVAGVTVNTKWFNTKADAERFMRTGDDSKAINH